MVEKVEFYDERREIMLHINEIEMYYAPRKNIMGRITNIQGEPEMNEDESAFLCGIIKKYSPNKIVEVGIAGGGTSAIILSCLQLLAMKESKLYSVDYSQKFYRNNDYQSGFLGKEAREVLGLSEERHIILTGDIACSFEEIKDGIDLLIIDTMHILPGELLDFITLLPALNENAIVVLHDVALAYMLETHRTYIATNVLFACAVGDKYINTFEFSGKYSNIAAIKVNTKTKDWAYNVFLGLLVPWMYIPDEKQVMGYRSVIQNYYPKPLLELFDTALQLNKKKLKTSIQFRWLFPFNKVSEGDRIVLFGTGEVGKAFVKQIKHTGYCDIVGIVDNNEKKWGDTVQSPDKIKYMQYDFVVVAVANENIAGNIKRQLSDLGIIANKIVWCDYFI